MEWEKGRVEFVTVGDTGLRDAAQEGNVITRKSM